MTSIDCPQSATDGAGDARLEQLVARALERREREGAAAVDELCADHPELAEGIRACVAVLDDVGLDAERQATSLLGLPASLDEFQLVRRLGGGAMGVVYLARQPSLGREVAVKIVRPEYALFGQARRRFQREVAAVARLQHPAIVPVHAVGESSGIPYFVMERIEGCTLSEVLSELAGRRPDELTGRSLLDAVQRVTGLSVPGNVPDIFAGTWSEVCLRIAREIASALEHAHRHGVLHRDVKSSNIMVTPTGRVLLLDFGLARSEDATRITRTGSTVGSLPYTAPEQLHGGDDVDRRADVYSLGVTLYELLALRLPYRSESSSELRRLIREGRPDPLALLNPRVPPDAETVCLCAMDVDPHRRYARAERLAEDLDRALSEGAVRARRPGRWLLARRWAQRHPALSVALVAGWVLLIGSVGFGVEQRLLRQEAERARLEAQRQADDSKGIIDLFNKVFIAAAGAARAGQLDTVWDLLDRAARMLQSSAKGPPLVRARAADVLADYYLDMGRADSAGPLVDLSFRLREEHSDGVDGLWSRAYLNLGRMRGQQGRAEEALEATRRALELRIAHRGSMSLAVAEARRFVAGVLHGMGDTAGAERELAESMAVFRELKGEVCSDIVALLNRRAGWRFREGRFVDARSDLEQSRAIASRVVGQADPLTAQIFHMRARLALATGDYPEAAEVYRECHTAYEKVHGEWHPSTVSKLGSLARMLELYGDDEAASDVLDELIGYRREAPVLGLSVILARSALCLARLGRLDEAWARAAEAERELELAEREVPTHVASVARALGLMHREVGDAASAERAFRRAIEHLDGDPRLADAAGWTRVDLAEVLRQRGDAAAADTLMNEAAVLLSPPDATSQRAVTRPTSDWGHFLLMAGRLSEAETVLREHLASATPSGERPWLGALDESLLGEALTRGGHLEEAEARLLPAYERITADHASPVQHVRDVVRRIVALYEAWGRPDDAAHWRERLSPRRTCLTARGTLPP